MVRLMVGAVEQRRGRVDIVVGGVRRDDLRRAALRVCGERFGAGEWHVCEEHFRPTMLSRAGGVRLWEGRFGLERSA